MMHSGDSAKWCLLKENTVKPTLAYQNGLGHMFLGAAKENLLSPFLKGNKEHVQVIFTSPPFPLNREKRYGNLQGPEYIEWHVSLLPFFAQLLTPNGSIVIEMGTSREPGRPLNIRSFLSLLDKGDLRLYQQFVLTRPDYLVQRRGSTSNGPD